MQDNDFNYIERLSDFDDMKVRQVLTDGVDGKLNIGLCITPVEWVADDGSKLNTFENLSPKACLDFLRRFQVVKNDLEKQPAWYWSQSLELQGGRRLIPCPKLKQRAEQRIDAENRDVGLKELLEDDSFRRTMILFWLDRLFIERERSLKPPPKMTPDADAMKSNENKRGDLNLIGALVELLVVHKKSFHSERQLYMFIEEGYRNEGQAKPFLGLTEKTLSEKFKKAREQLAEERKDVS